MLRTLDRYVIREIIPPFLLTLLVFTFILAIPPVMDQLETLVAKGVPWQTAGRIILTLVPQALGLTIPMALLVSLLIGLGRLSADREFVALLACGVSPYRLLVPVLLFATLAAAVTMYVMIAAIPDANQTFRQITFDLISKRVEHDIRPRVFFEDFPGWVLYARDEPDPGTTGWKDVLVADTRKPEAPELFLANRGRLVLDREHRTVDLILTDGTRYAARKPGETQTYRFPNDLRLGLDPETVFRRVELQRDVNEKTIPQLRATIAEKRRTGTHSPHPEIIAIHQKFSIPAACLVFAVIGLAVGLSVAREGRLAGFVVGIAVIFVYYAIMFFSESLAKGQWISAEITRWVPNIILGVVGIAAFVWRARYAQTGLPFALWFPAARLPASWRRRADGARPPAGVTGGPRRVVIVVRVPRLRMPMPGLLDRYITRLYMRVAALSFVGLLGLFFIATVVDKSEKVFKGQATTEMVATLLIYRTPEFVYYIIPIAALLSALVTFGLLSRSSELTVMKACGISLYRASASVVVVSLMFSAVLYGLEQQILGRANRQADALDSRIRGLAPRTFNPLNRRWVVGREGAIYHYGYFDPDRNELANLTVYRTRPDAWALDTQTFATRAVFKSGWLGKDGWIQDFKEKTPRWEVFAERPVPLAETPDYFKTEQPIAELMTVPQLRRYVADLSASGFNVVPLRVELQRKLAFPFVTFVMTLLAVPFGVSTGRRGTLYGIGLGIVIALTYWIASSAFVAVGRAGLLSPTLAAWTPNILVLGCAAYLFLRVRT